VLLGERGGRQRDPRVDLTSSGAVSDLPSTISFTV